MGSRISVYCAVLLALIVQAVSAEKTDGVALETAKTFNLSQMALGPMPIPFSSGSLEGPTHPTFEIVESDGQHVVSEAEPNKKDVLFYRAPQPLKAIQETFSFTYSGPDSVVEPFLVQSTNGPGNSLRGILVDLTASHPGNNTAGDENFVYKPSAGSSNLAMTYGRLRTEPYYYRMGHTYTVDVIADSEARLLTTRVYDASLGPTAFDQSIREPLTAPHYPGVVNALGGHISLRSFAYGPAGYLPILPHIARPASEYMNYLGYNAAIQGPPTTVPSLAFQKYFPLLLVKHVRIAVDGGDYAPSLNAVSKYGINGDLLTSPQTTTDSLRRFVAGLSVPPDSIELWNEPNRFFPKLAAFAQSLYLDFPKVTILGPSLLPDSNNYPSLEAKLADSVGPYITEWNAHTYLRAIPESTGYGGFFSGACGETRKEDCGIYGSASWNDNNSAAINPKLDGVTTEGAASYGTYPDICGANDISLEAQQAYVQRGMLYNFKLGHRRIYPYKFLDDGGCSDGFGTFGIMSRIRDQNRKTILVTPKPAYTALVYLNHLISDASIERDIEQRPGTLSYALDDAGPDIEELLLSEPDGTYRLILWTDRSLWRFDANGPKRPGSPLPPVEEPVTLRLGATAKLATFDQEPSTGIWRLATSARSKSLAIGVTQFPTIVAIDPSLKARAMILPRDVPTPGPIETPSGDEASSGL